MDMFQSILETIPKTRSQIVNDLDIPEDLTVAPYNWSELEESLDCDSIPSVSIEEFEVRTVGSDSSLSLSRAMTDSEIDYDRYRKLRNRSSSDPWAPIRIAIDAFPTDYINSLNSFQGMQSESPEALNFERHKINEELKQKMERFFEDECRLFSPDDPGLKILEEALQNVDLESSDLESDLS